MSPVEYLSAENPAVLRGNLIGRTHDQTVSMRVHKMPIDPGIPRQIARISRQFACGQHKLVDTYHQCDTDPHRHFGICNRTEFPESANTCPSADGDPTANTLYGGLIICDIIRSEIGFAGKRHLFDFVPDGMLCACNGWHVEYRAFLCQIHWAARPPIQK